MKKIREFINRHKVLSWIVGIFLGLVLIDSIINNDFDNLLSMLYSLFMMSIYLFLLYLMISKKNYLCPNCKKKIKKRELSCPHCGKEIDGKTTKVISKRVFSRSPSPAYSFFSCRSCFFHREFQKHLFPEYRNHIKTKDRR